MHDNPHYVKFLLTQETEWTADLETLKSHFADEYAADIAEGLNDAQFAERCFQYAGVGNGLEMVGFEQSGHYEDLEVKTV